MENVSLVTIENQRFLNLIDVSFEFLFEALDDLGDGFGVIFLIIRREEILNLKVDILILAEWPV